MTQDTRRARPVLWRRILALALITAAALLVPVAPAPGSAPPTPLAPVPDLEGLFRAPDLPDQFDWHKGRVYMFAALPTGSLTKVDALEPADAPAIAAADFDGVEYVDENDIAWYLASPLMSASHQPDWAQCLGSDGQPGDCPFKKFTSPTGNGGSYEAILMPDGASLEARPLCAQAECPYTYEALNWLKNGSLIGTWNYSDPSTFSGSFQHVAWDVAPHDLSSQYVELPPERWRESKDFVDFEGYPNHLRDEMLRLIDGDDVARAVDGTVYHVTNAEDGASVVIMALLASVDEPVDPDSGELVFEAAGALGHTRYGLAPPGSSDDVTLQAALGPAMVGECTTTPLAADQMCWTNLFREGHGLISYDIVHADGLVEAASTGPLQESDQGSGTIWQVSAIFGPRQPVTDTSTEPEPATEDEWCSQLQQETLDAMFHGGPPDEEKCKIFLTGDGFE